MVGHHHLRAVGHQNMRCRNAVVRHALDLGNQLRDIERHAVANDIHRVLVAYAGGKQMQRKAAVIIDDRVPCVRTALKADDDIRFAGKQVGDFPLALVAPVGADNRFNHVKRTSIKLRRKHTASSFPPCKSPLLKRRKPCKQKYS